MLVVDSLSESKSVHFLICQHFILNQLQTSRAETITQVTRIIRLQKMIVAKFLPLSFICFLSPALCGLLSSGGHFSKRTVIADTHHYVQN